MNLFKKITDNWSRLSKVKKAAIYVLIIIVLGVLLYSISFKIGEAIGDVFWN